MSKWAISNNLFSIIFIIYEFWNGRFESSKRKNNFSNCSTWEIFDHITNSAFLANQKICRAPTKKLSARDSSFAAGRMLHLSSPRMYRGRPQPPRLCDRQVVCRCNRQPTRKLSSHQIPGSTNLLGKVFEFIPQPGYVCCKRKRCMSLYLVRTGLLSPYRKVFEQT